MNMHWPLILFCAFLTALDLYKHAYFYPLTFCMTAYLVMRARPRDIPALIVLYLTSLVLLPGPKDIYTPSLETIMEQRGAGFRYVFQSFLAGNVFVAAKVGYELMRNPGIFRKKIPWALIVLWLMAFMPVLVGTWLGRLHGNEMWTRGIRIVMISGAFFYGHLWARKLNRFPPDINKFLFVISIAFIICSYLGLAGTHMLFIFLGIGSANAVFMIFKGKGADKLLGLLLFILVLAIPFFGTLTMTGIVFMTVIISMLSIAGQKLQNQRAVCLAMGSVVSVSLVLTFAVAHLGVYYKTDPKVKGSRYEHTFLEKVEYKVFLDRFPIWHTAYKQIQQGPYFIVPSGRPLFTGEVRAEYGWLVGSHNSILEVLRLNGLFAGAIILCILFYALLKAALVAAKSRDPALRCLSAAIIGTAVVGMTTGDFPVDMIVGFPLWALAGMAHGLYLKENQVPRSRPVTRSVTG